MNLLSGSTTTGMAAVAILRRRHRQSAGIPLQKERMFLTLIGMSEETIIQCYRPPSHAILQLLDELKDDLETTTNRSHTIPSSTKHSTLDFPASSSFQCTVRTSAVTSQPALSNALSMVLNATTTVLLHWILLTLGRCFRKPNWDFTGWPLSQM